MSVTLISLPIWTSTIRSAVSAITVCFTPAGMRTCMVPDRIPYTDALRPYVDDVRASLNDVIPLILPWLS